MSIRRVLSVLTAGLLLAAWIVGTAHASHYRLAESGLVSADELAALAKIDVRTTKDVVDKLSKRAERKSASKATRLSSKRLLALARTCDLLRLDGVGMIMASLLTAAGASDTKALRSKDPKRLEAAVNAANAAKKITEVTPNAAQLGRWIAQAKSLKQVLETR